MISAFASTWKVPELRERILFTLAIVVIVRLGVHVTLPGVDASVIAEYLADKQKSGGDSGPWCCRRCHARFLLWGWPPEDGRVCPRHHALHLRIHYDAAHDRRCSLSFPSWPVRTVAARRSTSIPASSPSSLRWCRVTCWPSA